MLKDAGFYIAQDGANFSESDNDDLDNPNHQNNLDYRKVRNNFFLNEIEKSSLTINKMKYFTPQEIANFLKLKYKVTIVQKN